MTKGLVLYMAKSAHITLGKLPYADEKFISAIGLIKEQIYWCTSYVYKAYYKSSKKCPDVTRLIDSLVPHICDALYKTYNDCVVYTGNSWYTFIETKWVESITVPNIITRHFELLALDNIVLNVTFGQEPIDEVKVRIVLAMSEVSSRNTIETIIKARFTNLLVTEKLKTYNREIIVFTNGTFSLNNEGFRPSKTIDYSTKTLSYSFNRDHNESLAKELQTYLDSIVPRRETQNELLRLLASFINKYKKEKVLVIRKVEESSGLTVFIDFLETVFECYSDKFRVIHLTNGTITDSYIDNMRRIPHTGVIIVCNSNIRVESNKLHRLLLLNFKQIRNKDPLISVKLRLLAPVFMSRILSYY